MSAKTTEEMAKLISEMVDSKFGPLDFIRRHIVKLDFLETVADPVFEEFTQLMAANPKLLKAKKLEGPLDARRFTLAQDEIGKFADLCGEVREHRDFEWYLAQVKRAPQNERLNILNSETIVNTLNEIERDF